MISQRTKAQFIETSDVVRRVNSHLNLSRSEMPSTNVRTKTEPDWLGNAIISEITRNRVVVSGIREKEVHETLLKNHVNLTVIGLWCPSNERFGRVHTAGKCKDYAEFIQHDQAEREIGLDKLLREVETVPTTFWDMDETIDWILKRHLSKAWK